MTLQKDQHFPNTPDAPVVLVVEDHEAYREIVRRALESYVPCVKAVGAGSVGEALSVLRKNPVNVVVIDMTLPDGTALDLLAQASQLVAHGMKVILFSNYSSVEMAPLLERPDVHAVFAKEQGLRDLARVVREICPAADGSGMSRPPEAV